MAFQDYFGYRIVTKAMKISLSPKATIKYSKANILSVSPAASVLPVKKNKLRKLEEALRETGQTRETWGDRGDMRRQWTHGIQGKTEIQYRLGQQF